MSNKDKKDDLLDRAEELLDRANNSEYAEQKKPTIPEQFKLLFLPIINKLGSFSPFLKKVFLFIGSVFGVLASWFTWAVYTKPDINVASGSEADEGIGEVSAAEGQFSTKRFFITLCSVVIIGFLLHILLSAIYFYSTKFTETVYVTGKQEIETGEIYQFGGCTSLPCSTANDNGKFYLIESSLYFPYLAYPEQDVFANIPLQSSACEITGYGFYFRNLRWVYKKAQLYQHIIDVSCRPYTRDELDKVISDGKISHPEPSSEN